MLDELLLLSGMDIPFQEAQLVIHQPRLKEIAFIGEEALYSACGVLNFSKNNLDVKDKIDLEKLTNFEILMSIMMDSSNPIAKQNQINVKMLFALMFPEYQVMMQPQGVLLVKDKEIHSINKENFEEFKKILIEMFCLKRDTKDGNLDYNPGGNRAAAIAEKLRKGREKAAAAKGEDKKKIAILSRYASIIAIGNHKDLNDLMNYTVYQIFDEFERMDLKIQNDFYMQAKLAGAKDLQDIDNWMKELHS